MNPETSGVRWRKVTLIGVGLLGGSIGMALRKARLCGEVMGYVRRNRSVSECQRLGAVDRATTRLKEAVGGADLVILCTPLGQMGPLAQQLAPFLERGAVVTDVGSVKARVIRELEKVVLKAGGRFVGSHPMAGGEKPGVKAAREDLFAKAVCVVTPTAKSNANAVRQVRQLWTSLGCRIRIMDADTHDVLVSRCSHLPQLLATQLAHFVLEPEHPREQRQLCANGFRDTTRIASSSPEMWRDIVLANRRHIARSLSGYIRDLTRLKRMVQAGDSGALLQTFETARTRRNEWLAGHGAQ